MVAEVIETPPEEMAEELSRSRGSLSTGSWDRRTRTGWYRCAYEHQLCAGDHSESTQALMNEVCKTQHIRFGHAAWLQGEGSCHGKGSVGAVL